MKSPSLELPIRRLPSGWFKAVATLMCVAAAWAPAGAQRLAGTVRDSTSRIPVPGAVVVALDAGGTAVGRGISDGAGRFVIVSTSLPAQLQVMRIGFRPRIVPLPPGARDAIDLMLTALPTLLERVDVIAAPSPCPRRPDAPIAAALLDQTRAALLATVVARESNPATVSRITFDRELDANGSAAIAQSVRTETVRDATVSFGAAHAAVDFARHGFATDTGSARMFFGPDAEVLLHADFAQAYCFGLAAPGPDRRLVGLTFSPLDRRPPRVDIEGAVWVDTIGRQLSHIEFAYRGLDPMSEAFGAGGRIAFREVIPGVTLIDRWHLRLVGGADSAIGVARTYAIREIGGELASAEWQDGRRWEAAMASIRITARDADARPIPGAHLTLVGTDYAGVTDEAGHATISRLVPGPYRVGVVDPVLAAVGVTIPTDEAFIANREPLPERTVEMTSTETFVRSLCEATGLRPDDGAWLIGRFVAADGRPVPDARWRISRGGAAGWEPVDGGTIGAASLFTYCRGLRVGQTVQVQAWRDRDPQALAVRQLGGKVTAVLLTAPGAVVAQARGSEADLQGVVVDSLTGAAVSGAFVEVAGTSRTAVTDSTGTFRVGGLPRGTYTLLTRTPELDDAGAVSQSRITHDGRTPARVALPTPAALVAAACGRPLDEGTGVVNGAVGRADDGAVPAGLRVMAEWTAPDGAVTVWQRTRVDADGTFRICGAPAGVPVHLYLQAARPIEWGAAPRRGLIDARTRFGRADLVLEPGLTAGATFSGTVVADSTDDPVTGASVELPGLGRVLSTNADGAFFMGDIPPGTHRVVVRKPGFNGVTADVEFGANQGVDHRIVLGMSAVAIAPVAITAAPSVNEAFDRNRKLGLGKFLTRQDLSDLEGRRLADAFAIVPNLGIVTQASASHAWVVGKRVPPRIGPRIGELAPNAPGATDAAVRARAGCGYQPRGALNPNCFFTMDDLREQGYYCPQPGESMRGISCACYAQVWVDGRLVNRERPTEPFDLNTYAPEQLEAVEWYASPSQTPAQYSSLNSPCGVLVLWTRRSGLF